MKIKKLKKLIINIYKKIKYKFYQKNRGLILFKDFIFQLIQLNSNQLCLFHSEPWHYNWDLETRKKIYKKIIGDKNVIFINFKSLFMVKLLIWKLSIKKEKNRKIIKKEFLYKGLWDSYIKKDFTFNNLLEYINIFDAFKLEIDLNDNLYFNIQKLISSSKIDSIAIIQPGFFDWWLTFVGYEYQKYIIIPEYRVGFVKSKKIDDYLLVRKFNEYKKNNKLTTNSYKSIINRINGRYDQSYLTLFTDMSPIYKSRSKIEIDLKKINIILFMHIFSDCPNSELNSTKDFNYLDHFAFVYELCSKMKNYNNINLYLRPHPEISKFSSENKYNLIIDRIVKENDNIIYLSNNISIKELNLKFKNSFICLTGKGSVSLECAFLNIPVFNYINNIYTKLGFVIYVYSIDYFFKKVFSKKRKKINKNNILYYEQFVYDASKKNIFELSKYSRHKSLKLIDLVNQN